MKKSKMSSVLLKILKVLNRSGYLIFAILAALYGEGFSELRWKQEASVPAFERIGHKAVVYKGNIWVIGGREPGPFGGYESYELKNDVWRSPDGKNWIPMPNGPFTARSDHAIIVFQNKIWIFGGIQDGGSRLGDVWSFSYNETTQVGTWDPEPQHPTNNFGNRSNHSVQVISDDHDFLIMIGGRVNSTPSKSVLKSDDGSEWTPWGGVPDFSPRFDHGHFVDAPNWSHSIIIGGSPDATGPDELNDVWTNYSNAEWDALNPYYPIDQPTRFDASEVVKFRDDLWVLDGYNEYSAPLSVSTLDLDVTPISDAHWAPYPSLSLSRDHWDHEAVEFNGRIWVIGGGETGEVLATEELFRLDVGVSPLGAGTVLRTPSGTFFPLGTSVQVNAQENDGFLFDEWTGSHPYGAPTQTIIMDADKSIIANFTQCKLSRSGSVTIPLSSPC